MSDSEWNVVKKPKKYNPVKSQSLTQQSAQYHQQRMQGTRTSSNDARRYHAPRLQRAQQDIATSPSAEETLSQTHDKEDNRKSLTECGFTDIAQIRRMVPHLETIANYSKGGIVGAVRGKMIHNSEDREQRIGVLMRDVKLTSQEEAFVRHIMEHCDNDVPEALGFSREDADTLLGFLTIVLSCIAHTRYYKSANQTARGEDAGDEPEERDNDAEEDNYHIYHESMKEVNVWKQSQIASNLSESLRRDLQQKFDTNPPVLDAQKLQQLLLGQGFKFDYAGNLSVPYCLEVLHPYLNCNESKTVRQRRSLYRYEQKAPGSRGPAPERAAWRSPSVQRARDYKSQVEAFEAKFLEGEGIPTDGTSTLSSLLHCVYTAFLKIRKKQTPKNLLEKLRTLLLALPNLIQLPELLQQVKGDKTWAGYPSIEEYPDLPDYRELKARLVKYLAKEGVTAASSDEDQVRKTLESLYQFNRVEQEKLEQYLTHLKRERDQDEDDEGSEDAENAEENATAPPPKGYPLDSRYIEAFLDQLKVKGNKTYKKELDQLAPFRE